MAKTRSQSMSCRRPVVIASCRGTYASRTSAVNPTDDVPLKREKATAFRCRSVSQVVGCDAAVGEVIAFAELVRMRRQRVARAVHARCRVLIAASIEVARAELKDAPPRERGVRVTRLRKLEQYAGALG